MEDGPFSVHIASYKEFADAHALFSHLVGQGYEVHLIPVNIPEKGHWYRVTLGRFKNREEAFQYANKLFTVHKFQYAEPLYIAKSEAMEIEKRPKETHKE